VDGLDDWLADAQAREAADERIRERWLRQQAADEAAFAGLLADLAERGETCVLTTAGARLHRGRVVAVGADFVAVRADGEWGEATVSDRGAGIPEEQQSSVFEKFARRDLAGAPSGTGLGLYIAKGLIEAHGGEMGLVSKEGVGSTFWFRLPRWTE